MDYQDFYRQECANILNQSVQDVFDNHDRSPVNALLEDAMMALQDKMPVSRMLELCREYKVVLDPQYVTVKNDYIGGLYDKYDGREDPMTLAKTGS